MHYSNPDVTFKNKPTGTATRNNTQQLRNSGLAVANFYQNSPTTVMAVDILQPNPNVCCTSVTAEADVYCGTAPYYFNWLISYDGVNWTLLPNSETVTFNTACDKSTLIIELAVTDANGQFKTVRRYYNADCGQSWRTSTTPDVKEKVEEPAGPGIIQKMYPNPAAGVIKTDVNITKTENIKIDVVDVLGNSVKQVFTGTLPKGRKTIEINTQGLRAGTYRLRVVTKDKQEHYLFSVLR